jgi:hypothetical protein
VIIDQLQLVHYTSNWVKLKVHDLDYAYKRRINYYCISEITSRIFIWKNLMSFFEVLNVLYIMKYFSIECSKKLSTYFCFLFQQPWTFSLTRCCTLFYFALLHCMQVNCVLVLQNKCIPQCYMTRWLWVHTCI